MFPGDARNRWKEELLSDPRVKHYWDPKVGVAGPWFRDHVARLRQSKTPGKDYLHGGYGQDRAAWDAFFLFGPDATWDAAPEPITSWGRPVYRAEAELRTDLRRLIKQTRVD